MGGGSRYKTVALLAFALAFIVLSSLGTLDHFAQKRIKKTMTKSLGIYATSRTINAGISILQTSQVKLPLIASVQVGEVLDPLNDAVERLSSVMTWAIGSLALQVFVLEVASSWVFKCLFLLISLAAIPALVLVDTKYFPKPLQAIPGFSKANLERYSELSLRVFVFAVIFRFIVPVFVTTSFLLSQTFLGAEIDKYKENLSWIREQMPHVAKVDSPDSQEIKRGEVRKVSELEKESEKLKKLVSEQEKKKLDLNEQLDAKEDWLDWLDRWRPEFIGGAPPRKEPLELQEVKQNIEKYQKRIQAIETDLDCIRRIRAGEDCDSWLKAIWKKTDISKNFEEVSNKADEIVENLVRLLSAIVIENILLPLVFLAIAIKCSLPLARHSTRLISAMRRDAKELRGYMGKGD